MHFHPEDKFKGTYRHNRVISNHDNDRTFTTIATTCIKTRSIRSCLATAEVTRDADDAIQIHTRSSVVVPIDTAYMTSY